MLWLIEFLSLISQSKICEGIKKVTYSSDVLACCLLYYPYFNEYYKLNAILIEQQIADADLKRIQ